MTVQDLRATLVSKWCVSNRFLSSHDGLRQDVSFLRGDLRRDLAGSLLCCVGPICAAEVGEIAAWEARRCGNRWWSGLGGYN